MKKRISYFDLAKGIGIILVVLGHMENIDASLRVWISSFHMPLFFVVSGMLMAAKKEVFLYSNCAGNDSSSYILSREFNFKDLCVKKAKGILIPYFWFSLIYVPIDIMNLYIHNVDQHTFIQNILDSLTFSGISVMWFLPALFIAEVVAIWLISECYSAISNKLLVKSFPKYQNIISYIVLIVVSLIISILSFELWSTIRPYYDANANNYLICTLLGFVRVIFRGTCMSFHVIIGFAAFKLISFMESIYINKKSDNVNEKKIAGEIRGFSIALSIILFVLNVSLCMKNDAVDNHFLTLNNLPLYYTCAILGSLAIIFFSKGFDSIKPVDFLGKNSLIIMATHLQCYLLYAGILIAISIDRYVTRAKSYVYMFNSVLFTMIFETVVILIINAFFPFIVGKGSVKDLLKIFKKK